MQPPIARPPRGGLRGGKDLGYGDADSGDALPGTKDGIQAVAAEMSADVASERAADAWAKAAVVGDGASTGATVSHLASRISRSAAQGASRAVPPQRRPAVGEDRHNAASHR